MHTELTLALAAVCESPQAATPALTDALSIPRITAEEWTAVFALQAPPIASIYLSSGVHDDTRGRVAGFFSAVGAGTPAEPDHLAALLGLAAALSDGRQNGAVERALRREALAALLHEHLFPWLHPYLDAVRRVAGPGVRGWADLVSATVDDLGDAGAIASTPVHLAVAPELALPDDGGLDGLADALLRPIVTGIILLPADLQRAGRELGVGARLAERRRTLVDFLRSDAPGTFAWLADEARRQGAMRSEAGPSADHWRRRALASCNVLATLEDQARHRLAVEATG